MNNVDLKPCPFCGRNDQLTFLSKTNGEHENYFATVACGCGAHTSWLFVFPWYRHLTEKQLRKYLNRAKVKAYLRWNKRAGVKS